MSGNTLSVAGVFFALAIMPTLACEFDLDCEIGSRCAKRSGALVGVCVGGMFPGNRNDRVPVYDPLDLDQTVGNTCSFDIDCGISNKCVKSSYSIDGVCLRRR